MIYEGFTNKQVAAALKLTDGTARHYIQLHIHTSLLFIFSDFSEIYRRKIQLVLLYHISIKNATGRGKFSAKNL